MGLIAKICLAGLLALAILAGCRRKKGTVSHISDWLEKYYPGRFVVVSTLTSDPIKNLSFKVKNSVVAEKSDTLIQAVLKWDKRDANLGLTQSAIDSAFQKAARETSDARVLLQALKSAGLANAAVGVEERTAHILLFDPPSPENRQKFLLPIEKALKQWQERGHYNLRLAFMDEEFKSLNYGEIVPLEFWSTPGTLTISHMLFWLTVSDADAFKAGGTEKEWRFNDQSKRFEKYYAQAEEKAKAWVGEQLKKQVTLLNYSEVAPDEKHGERFGLKFPYTTRAVKEGEEAQETPEGYVSGVFNVDEETFTGLKLSKE